MYNDLTKEPEIIITPEHTLIDGYEFLPKSITIEMGPLECYPGERVSLAGVIAGYDNWNKHLKER